MDNRNIKSILQEALEKQIPASQINLLPVVQSYLGAGKKSYLQQGGYMNKNRTKRLVLSALTVIVVVLTLALITPQGHAFAQNIFQFFKRADSNEIPISPELIAAVEATQAMPTVPPPAPLITISDAYQVVGFSFLVPEVPDGFMLLGARANPTSISIEYEAQGGGGALIINESSHGFMQSEWDQAPEKSISQVKLGNLDAEIVQGSFVVFPGETVARWNPEAPILRLRWIFDGIWFEMAKLGDVESIKHLDREALLKLADRMMRGSFTLDIKEAESLAGFDVLEPTWVPSVLFFKGAAFEPNESDKPKNTVQILYYFYSEARGPSLASNGIVISQQPIDSIEDCRMGTGCLVGAGAQVETVQIGDTIGEYVIGVWEADNAGHWIWRVEPYLQRLRWEKNDFAFEILYMGPPEEVGKTDLLLIAENMK